jgi:hypothetical protein
MGHLVVISGFNFAIYYTSNFSMCKRESDRKEKQRFHRWEIYVIIGQITGQVSPGGEAAYAGIPA